MLNDFCKRTKNKDLFYLSFSPSPLFFHTILIIHISFMLEKNKEKKIREGEQEGNNLLLAGRRHGPLPSPPFSPPPPKGKNLGPITEIGGAIIGIVDPVEGQNTRPICVESRGNTAELEREEVGAGVITRNRSFLGRVSKYPGANHPGDPVKA